MNTYADLVTLLLTFFIALFSMSTLKEEAKDALAEGANQGGPTSDNAAITESTTSTGEPTVGVDISDIENVDLNNLKEYVEAYAEQNGLSGKIEVTEGEGAVFIRLNSDVFFGADSFKLKGASIPVLSFLGDCFAQVQEELMMINIYGHTAEVQSDNYAIKALMLSSERAAQVAIYFNDVSLIPGELLNPIGQGNTFPIADNSTREGREKNRRVDIALVSKKAQITGNDEILQLLRGTFDDGTYPKSGSVKDVLSPEDGTVSGTETPSAPSEAGSDPLEVVSSFPE